MQCPACRRPALVQESELLRLPHTVLFQCPYCRTVAAAVDAPVRRRSTGEGGEAAAA